MEQNLSSLAALLRANAYPGRGLMIGKSEDGKKAVFVYFIMGRSKNSRNRIFAEDGDGIIIYPFDPSAVEDPSLIIYHPVRVLGRTQIVTNGDQTDTIFNMMSAGKSFEDALATRKYEPDAPNYTPRISGAGWFDDGFSYKLSILKCPASDGGACGRFTYAYEPVNGVGHLIHTYRCDGNPIPSYTGEPAAVSVPNSISAFAEEIWDALNADNKVSLFVRYVDIESGMAETVIYNKNQQ